MNEFSQLELCSVLKSNLSRNGFVKPTPVQAKSIPPALEGRDVVATAQTGTGKTLAFALPMVQSLMEQKTLAAAVHAVILSPTRELAMQINETFKLVSAHTPIRTAVVVGGMDEQRQLKAIRGGAHVVIATPGRLVDFIDRRLIKLNSVKTLVLDEADRMLDMGFLPALKSILKQMPAERQTMLFSATIERSVAHLVDSYVKDPVRVTIGSITRPVEQIDLHVYEVEQDRKARLLRHLINNEKGSMLVFARTKHGTDRLAKHLGRDGIKAERIHGDRSQNQRNAALAGFKKGDFQVLVATDVAARGIHVDGIAHVVNYDLPQVPEDFIHRVGRTGRAGARGVASTFATRQERSDIRQIEKTINLQLQRQDVPDLGVEEAPVAREFTPKAKVIAMPEKKAHKPFTRSFGAKKKRFGGR
ncbi:MAG: DEAD/DEAH box helicase [Acidobacteria bacterium]|nr:DEAD/DEAH box helicase [Acidobacteriota bacterium]